MTYRDFLKVVNISAAAKELKLTADEAYDCALALTSLYPELFYTDTQRTQAEWLVFMHTFVAALTQQDK